MGGSIREAFTVLIRRTSRQGLGATWRVDSSGNAVDCDLWSNILNAVCWGAAQGERPYLPSPPAPLAPPAVGQALSTVPALYQCSDGSMATAATNCPDYTAAIDAALAAGEEATQANELDFFTNLAATLPNPATCSSTIISNVCNSYVYIGAAVCAGLLIFMTMQGRAR